MTGTSRIVMMKSHYNLTGWRNNLIIPRIPMKGLSLCCISMRRPLGGLKEHSTSGRRIKTRIDSSNYTNKIAIRSYLRSLVTIISLGCELMPWTAILTIIIWTRSCSQGSQLAVGLSLAMAHLFTTRRRSRLTNLNSTLSISSPLWAFPKRPSMTNWLGLR